MDKDSGRPPATRQLSTGRFLNHAALTNDGADVAASATQQITLHNAAAHHFAVAKMYWRASHYYERNLMTFLRAGENLINRGVIFRPELSPALSGVLRMSTRYTPVCELSAFSADHRRNYSVGV
ncbi:hypothetical protein [Mycobacterium sp.]|uniref:hypothetical protein n=1 Tax=Mycobacterium sp. TaxID=1785 RepID=UPI001272DC82|nr:hypothetical protein [Mycobacterium sp.]KAA8969138.1 MAG: hypothetical protein F6Q13_04070 [Mycobacterium sp.]